MDMTLDIVNEPLAPVDAMTLRRPSSLGVVVLAGYLVLFILRPWEELFPWLLAFPIERAYAIVMIALVAFTGRGVRWNRQTLGVTAFAITAAVSTIRAWQTEYAWPSLYQYATVVITYFLIIAACRIPSDLMWLLFTYIATMWAYLAKSLWEFFVHGRHQYAQGVTRLVGIEYTYGESNSLAMSCVLSLPIWYFLWKHRDGLCEGCGSSIATWYRVTITSYPVLAVIAIGLTNSRAGMIGLAACIVGLIWFAQATRRLGRSALLAVALLSILWFVTPAEQQGRLQTLWNPGAGPSNAQASASGRWEGFLAARQMLRDRPLTGVGLGNFVPYRVAYLDGIALVAHNLPGQVLGELGWLGAIGFGLMAIPIWRTARRVEHWTAEDDTFAIYRDLARMIQLTILLLLLFGLSLHNALRFNWVWMAGFALLLEEFSWTAYDNLSDLTVPSAERRQA